MYKVVMTALREARRASGMTQVQLSARVGYTQQTLSLVELGGSSGCPELRRRLAIALATDEGALFPARAA